MSFLNVVICFNASLKWDVTGLGECNKGEYVWIIQIAIVMKSIMLVSRGTFTESSSKGYYGHTKQNDRSVYADVMASINKIFLMTNFH